MPAPLSIDLKARARQAMLDNGFKPDFSAAILAEIQSPPSCSATLSAPKDLRNLLWSSIDNSNSRDLDQIEYAERLPDGSIRLLIGIADVDARVPRGSATDVHAASECTTVYTGAITFPMLPESLSTDKTSLVNQGERQAIIIELTIPANGEIASPTLSLATVTNHAKLAYDSVGAWLEDRAPVPPAVAAVPGLDAQLKLQWEASRRLQSDRRAKGSLVFGTVETASVIENNQIKDFSIDRHNAAEDIIESFMVAANTAMAQALKSAGLPALRRVVKTPKRWDRIQTIAAPFGFKLPDVPDARALSEFLTARKAADPLHFADLSLSVIKMLGAGEYIVEHPGEEHEGHFGLALSDYTHATAPNRRYADLVTQRLLKSKIAGQPSPYSEAELTAIAQRCTEREDSARKVERLMRKVVAAMWLSQRVGQCFDAVVTGAGAKGTFVRLLKFPAEGMLTRGASGLDVGDLTHVQLLCVDIQKGFIDFERC